jgi:hypothetical protein
MSCRLKIIGSQSRIETVLGMWPKLPVTGGHTTIEFKPGTHGQDVAYDIYQTLVTEYSFTPLVTTVPDAPEKAPRNLPDALPEDYEVTFIPQYAGG